MRIIVMWRPLLLPLTLLLPVASLTACSASNTEGEVVASFYPLQYVAERIVGDHEKVTNLTAPGVEPHDIELSPRQAARVAGASVVFYEKGLQPAVDEAVKNEGPKHVVDAAEAVHLRHATVAGEDGDIDPHFWQDPTLLGKAADAFTTEMSKADPEHASDYEANNARLQADLKALDGEYRTGLKDCTTRTLVVSHDAFEYLGARYDLDVHPIAGLSPDAEPSARHLAELADLIRSDKITTVFNERLASPKLADSLAHDLGIRTEVLDPIEGLTSSNDHDDYLSLMRENLSALRKAGGCQ
jgi:zinc transport system substrate-binding protein